MVRTDAFSAIMPTAPHLTRTKLRPCDVVLTPSTISRTDSDEMAFEKIKLIRVNGLRVYNNPAGTDRFGGLEVFYSRREDGPYYRWRYEPGLGHWSFSRVHLSLLTRRTLCITCWEAVPSVLQTKLGEHYLD
jgi:hypothetical protein